MLTWKCFEILSYGAGTPSTTLALMACENAFHGPPYPYPLVPIYDAVIFCDLHAEPGWVYRPHCQYPVLDAWRGWQEGPYAPPVYI